MSCTHPVLKWGISPPQAMAQSQKQSPILHGDKEKEPEIFEVRAQHVKFPPKGCDLQLLGKIISQQPVFGSQGGNQPRKAAEDVNS